MLYHQFWVLIILDIAKQYNYIYEKVLKKSDMGCNLLQSLKFLKI